MPRSLEASESFLIILHPSILGKLTQLALSKKCTSVYDGEDGGDGEGDDKHDYLPTEDGARCPASLNTIQYRCPTCVLQYNKTCVLQCNTIQCPLRLAATCRRPSEAAPIQCNATQRNAIQPAKCIACAI